MNNLSGILWMVGSAEPMRVVPVFMTRGTDPRYFADITASLFNYTGV